MASQSSTAAYITNGKQVINPSFLNVNTIFFFGLKHKCVLVYCNGCSSATQMSGCARHIASTSMALRYDHVSQNVVYPCVNIALSTILAKFQNF